MFSLKQMELDSQKQLAELNTSNQKELVDKKEEGAMQREQMKSDAQKAKATTRPSSVTGPPKSGKPKQSFESKGNDTLGSLNLEQFEPK